LTYRGGKEAARKSEKRRKKYGETRQPENQTWGSFLGIRADGPKAQSLSWNRKWRLDRVCRKNQEEPEKENNHSNEEAEHLSGKKTQQRGGII